MVRTSSGASTRARRRRGSPPDGSSQSATSTRSTARRSSARMRGQAWESGSVKGEGRPPRAREAPSCGETGASGAPGRRTYQRPEGPRAPDPAAPLAKQLRSVWCPTRACARVSTACAQPGRGLAGAAGSILLGHVPRRGRSMGRASTGAAKEPDVKRTYQPKKRKRARTHGFRARMSTRAGASCSSAAATRAASGSPSDGGARARRRPSKRRRLSRSAEFERVYRQGRSKGNRFLVLYAFPREDERADARMARDSGLSVSRRVGGAVERNARQARAARGVLGRGRALPAGSDYVVVARPEARDSPSATASPACAPRWRSWSTSSAARAEAAHDARAHHGIAADPRSTSG